MKALKALATGMAVLFIGTAAFGAVTQPKTKQAQDPGYTARKEKDDAEADKSKQFQAYYDQYKRGYVYVGGSYILLPPINLASPNSRHGAPMPDKFKYMTEEEKKKAEEAREAEKTKTPAGETKVDAGDKKAPAATANNAKSKPEQALLPDAEIKKRERRWNSELPSLGVGEFGAWPEDEELIVSAINGPKDVTCKSGSASIRFSGVPTGGLRVGGECKVPPVAIVAASGGGLLAVPVAALRQGLSREEFIGLMNQGINPEKDLGAPVGAAAGGSGGGVYNNMRAYAASQGVTKTNVTPQTGRRGR